MEGQTKPGGGPCNNHRKGQHTAEERERKVYKDLLHRRMIPFYSFVIGIVFLKIKKKEKKWKHLILKKSSQYI